MKNTKYEYLCSLRSFPQFFVALSRYVRLRASQRFIVAVPFYAMQPSQLVTASFKYVRSGKFPWRPRGKLPFIAGSAVGWLAGTEVCTGRNFRKHRQFGPTQYELESYDLKSYVGSSVATGRVSHYGQVKSEVSDKETPWPSRLGVGHWVDIPIP
jgi:hypothetical protein